MRDRKSATESIGWFSNNFALSSCYFFFNISSKAIANVQIPSIFYMHDLLLNSAIIIHTKNISEPSLNITGF